MATVNHNVPTTSRSLPITDEIAKQQIDTLRQNCKDFGIRLYDLDDRNQGIVHVIGPELGLTQPGMTIVCGDSHTATHGAFGALAFGIGTSEVEHVLATQTLLQHKPRTLEIRVEGRLPFGVTAKDLILWLIGQISTSGGTGYCIEYTGTAIRALSMEERMTVCNMTIEAGARSGLIAPDEKTFEYLRGRPFAPKDFDAAVEQWKKLPSDPGADYDRMERFHAADIEPQVTWGTNPGQVTGIGGEVPDPASFNNPTDQKAAAAALEYMGLKPKTKIADVKIDCVFIGSCTNGRIEDLRTAAAVVRGHHVANGVHAIVVPGSQRVNDLARFVQAPGIIVVLYQGTTNSVHRTIFTDGRDLPKDPNPTWMGYSVGHWEGDTLVVLTGGFNDRGWLDIEGHPHTEALRITERFRRRDFGHMDLEMTIDDPKTFTRPFSLKIDKTLVPDTDLLESICENDTSVPHMLGGVEITKLAPEALARYAGVYEYGPGRQATITVDGDLLFLQEGSNPLKLPLAASSETNFVERSQGERLDFTRDAQGAITGFTFHARSGDRRAVRKGNAVQDRK